MDEMKQEAKILADVERQEAKIGKWRKCDWEDVDDVKEYHRYERQKKREAVLNRLVKNRVCPCCKSVRLSPRSWVVSKDEKKAVCRSCFHSGVADKKDGGGAGVKRNLFGDTTVRYAFDGFELSCVREAIGVSAAVFARRAGWKAVYQWKLESGKVKSVTLETAEVLLETIESFGFRTLDCL